jgi:ATP-dependent Clp protease adaptor protein ClpS
LGWRRTAKPAAGAECNTGFRLARTSRDDGTVSTPAPVEIEQPDVEDVVELENPWVTVVWNDPVNLMSYVAYVFRNYFGYSEQKATKLMLAVHNEGKAVVSSGRREQMERHVQAMHEYGLWATLQRADI